MTKLGTAIFSAVAAACVWAGTSTAQENADARIQAAIAAYQAAMKAEAAARANLRAQRVAAELIIDPGTPVIGNPDGDVAIIEFFDYQCPFCKAAEPRLRKLVMEDGNIRHVIKDFPILSDLSLLAAKAALASAKQGKHEQFHNAMMDHRGQLTEERMWRLAESVGIGTPQLREDMEDPEIADQLIANMNLARKLRVTVVPGFFVNTKTLSGLTNETVTADIDFDKEVAEARATK